ncbi:MAG: hypothetical protein U1F43_12555 [Myxococcota bacterium]
MRSTHGRLAVDLRARGAQRQQVRRSKPMTCAATARSAQVGADRAADLDRQLRAAGACRSASRTAARSSASGVASCSR